MAPAGILPVQILSLTGQGAQHSAMGLTLQPWPPAAPSSPVAEAGRCCGSCPLLCLVWSSPGYTDGHMQCSQCHQSGCSVQCQTVFCPMQCSKKMASVGFRAALFRKRALPLLLFPIWPEVSLQDTFRSSTSLKLLSLEIQK